MYGTSHELLARTTAPSTPFPAAQCFDQLVTETFLHRINLDASISDEARYQLSLPVRDGGFGLTSVVLVSPAGWYSAFAQAFPTIRTLIPDVNDLDGATGFVQTLLIAFISFPNINFLKDLQSPLILKAFGRTLSRKDVPVVLNG